MKVFKTIKKGRSIRSFENRPINNKILEKLIEEDN